MQTVLKGQLAEVSDFQTFLRPSVSGSQGVAEPLAGGSATAPDEIIPCPEQARKSRVQHGAGILPELPGFISNS